MRLFTPGCKTNTQIQAFLQERRCCVVVYLRYGVTALAREVIAIVLFTSGSKTILIYKRSCRSGVAVVLFTLETVFLHERQKELQAGKGGGRMVRALRCSGRADWDPPGARITLVEKALKSKQDR